MRLLIENPNEYRMCFVIAFVDYEKTFDSVELWAILDALYIQWNPRSSKTFTPKKDLL